MSSAPPPSPPAPLRWSPLRIIFLLLGGLLFALLVRRVGVQNLFQQDVGIGWSFAAIVLLFGGVHFLRSLTWRACLGEDGHRIPFRTLFALWLGGEAVSALSFAWSGEAFRAAATVKTLSLARGVSAQLVTRVLYTYASGVWITAGFLLVWRVVEVRGAVEKMMLTGTLVSVGLLLAATAALMAPERVLAPFVRWEERRYQRWPRPWRRRFLRFLHVLEEDVARTVGTRRQLLILLGQNVLAALAGVLEVYLILRGLGMPVSLSAAIVIEGLNKVLGLFAYVVPGNLGVREGGNVLILQLFGLTAVTGVNLVLIRRVRAMVWVGLGVLLLIRHGISPLAMTRSQDPAGPVTHVSKEALPPR